MCGVLVSSTITAAIENNNTVAEIVFHLIQNLPQIKLEIFVTIVWSIWKTQNMQIWQNVSETYQAILECARKLLQGWKEANLGKDRLGEGEQQLVLHAVSTESAGSSSSAEQQHISWKKPGKGGLSLMSTRHSRSP